jgi:hypothetical protein
VRREQIESEARDPRLVAALHLLERTGMRQFQLRYDDDEQPTVWMAVGLYKGETFECAAAPTPLQAVFRLCDQLIIGGTCTHCQRATGFEEEPLGGPMPLDETICWYRYDPERETFRRSCEGQT